MKEISISESSSYWADIYVSGDTTLIRHFCQEYVLRGLCVSIFDARYVYTGGTETGCLVRLINYARFPSDPATITSTALDLAKLLIEKLQQGSASVITLDKSYFLSRRDNDA